MLFTTIKEPVSFVEAHIVDAPILNTLGNPTGAYFTEMEGRKGSFSSPLPASNDYIASKGDYLVIESDRSWRFIPQEEFQADYRAATQVEEVKKKAEEAGDSGNGNDTQTGTGADLETGHGADGEGADNDDDSTIKGGGADSISGEENS